MLSHNFYFQHGLIGLAQLDRSFQGHSTIRAALSQSLWGIPTSMQLSSLFSAIFHLKLSLQTSIQTTAATPCQKSPQHALLPSSDSAYPHLRAGEFCTAAPLCWSYRCRKYCWRRDCASWLRTQSRRSPTRSTARVSGQRRLAPHLHMNGSRRLSPTLLSLLTTIERAFSREKMLCAAAFN